MGEANNSHSIADYLAQLLKDKKQIAAFPGVFLHVERLLDEEINKVRSNLFQINGGIKEPLALPEGQGPPVTISEKVYVPVKDHPDFNFVGRILGPRGMTAKQLEQETGCKIMVRGKGSMRDKKKEDQNRGKPNWEHLNDELHVLISVEDSENRAKAKLQRAIEEIRKLLVPSNDGEDELKKRQLMELAIINGTYRDSSSKNPGMPWLGLPEDFTYEDINAMQLNFGLKGELEYLKDFEALGCMPNDLPRLMAPGMTLASPLRAGTPLGGAPIIMQARLPLHNNQMNGHAGIPPPLIAASESHGLLYTPYAEYAAANYAALHHSQAHLIQPDFTQDPQGFAAKQRRHINQGREHPYQRAGSLS